MTLGVRSIDIDRLNSLTKYPSIPTYHALDPTNGNLRDEVIPFPGEVLLTEKIDGTNARIVCFPDGSYVIGSRTEFLLAKGDLIGNPALGIVDAVRDVAERITEQPVDGLENDGITVYFGEVYGGKVTQASKQYTGSRDVGFRLFDVVEVRDAAARLAMSPAALSEWREAGGQAFLDEARLQELAAAIDVAVTPRLGTMKALPTGLQETLDFLAERLPTTLSGLDDGAGGQPGGIVARSVDRTVIAKLRFGDYRRTLKRKAK